MKSRRALEDAITDLVPQMEELYEKQKGKPMFTPAEINACFPDLYKTEAHNHAMRRAASKDKTPEGKHVVAVCDYIPLLRGDSYMDAWVAAIRTFPNSTEVELRKYITDVLLFWCSPCQKTVPTAEELIESADMYLQDVYESWKSIRTNHNLLSKYRAQIEEVGEYAKARYERTSLGTDADELDAILQSLDEINTIEYILNGEYEKAWDNIERVYTIYTKDDIASHFIELMRVFKL